MFLQEIFVLEDCYKYIATGSKTFSTTSYTIENIYDIDGITGDFEISVTIKSTAQKGFGISLNTQTGTENRNLLRIGYNGSNYADITRMENGSNQGQYGESYPSSSKTYSANTNTILKLKRINGVYTAYIDDYSHFYNSAPTNPRYLQLESWSTSKTITYTDFKVKAL